MNTVPSIISGSHKDTLVWHIYSFIALEEWSTIKVVLVIPASFMRTFEDGDHFLWFIVSRSRFYYSKRQMIVSKDDLLLLSQQQLQHRKSQGLAAYAWCGKVSANNRTVHYLYLVRNHSQRNSMLPWHDSWTMNALYSESKIDWELAAFHLV